MNTTGEKDGKAVSIKRITPELCVKFHDKLSGYYYANMRDCVYTDGYPREKADEKIDEMLMYLREDKALVFGAFFGELLVGYVWTYKTKFRNEERIYVTEVRVDEEWQGNGIGTRLLNFAEDTAAELGIGALFIHAEAVNTGAVKLYKALGYDFERFQMRKSVHGKDGEK